MDDNLVKRLRDWQHVYPEDEDKPEGYLYEVAADHIEALEAENKRLREAMEWKPIETAPSDGTRIVVHNASLWLPLPEPPSTREGEE